MKLKSEKLNYVIYWWAIFLAAGSMFVYGIANPFQFTGFEAGENSCLSAGHQVMWTFYSFTETYPIIIGLMKF